MIIVPLLLSVAVPLGVVDPVFYDGFDGVACPAGRIGVSDVAYFDGTLSDVDVTSFDNLLGRFSAGDPPEPFPSTGSSAEILDFTMSGFLAAGISIAPNTPDYYSGDIGYAKTTPLDNPHVDFSISPRCADFSPTLGACVALDVAPQSGRAIYWRLASTDPLACNLEIGRDYYFNLRVTDPSAPSSACPNGVCSLRMSSEVALP